MARRVRVVLLIITAMVLGPGVVVGMVIPNDASPASTSLVEASDSAQALVAVPVKSPLPAGPRGLPQAAIVLTLVAAGRLSVRRRSMRGLPFRLGDVGDRWRAELFGAPPSLL
jgi:hypothetical protein